MNDFLSGVRLLLIHKTVKFELKSFNKSDLTWMSPAAAAVQYRQAGAPLTRPVVAVKREGEHQLNRTSPCPG